MKNLLTYILLFSAFVSWGQKITDFGSDSWKDINNFIIYYNFYDGVQMIEIDLRAYSAIETYFLDFTQPINSIRYSYFGPNVFVFRNENGEIIAQYNSSDKIYNKSDFKPVAKIKDKTISHYSRYTSMHISIPNNEMHNIQHIPSDYCNLGILRVGTKDQDSNYSFGLIDTLGNFILAPIYNSINCVDSIYIVGKAHKYGILNSKFQTLIPFKYNSIIFHSHNIFFAYDENNKIGIINKNDSIIIPFEYDEINYQEPPLNFIYKKEGKFGLMDSTFKEISPNQYTYLKHSPKGFNAQKNNNWGILDYNGKEIIPCIYPYGVSCFGYLCKYYAVTYKNSQYYTAGLLDSLGNLITEKSYKKIEDFRGGYAKVLNENNQWGVIDSTGKEIITCKYDDITNDFAIYGYSEVTINRSTGVVNLNGEEIIPLEGYHYNNFSFRGDDIASTYFNNETIYYNLKNGEILPNKYFLYGYFNKGIARVKDSKGKFGFINKDWELIVPYKYDEASELKGNLAMVKYKGKYGFIDSTGNEVISPKYDEVAYDFPSFYWELIVVKYKHKVGFIDRKGNVVIPIEYDKVVRTLTGQDNSLMEIEIKKNGQTYYFNGKGVLINKLD